MPAAPGRTSPVPSEDRIDLSPLWPYLASAELEFRRVPNPMSSSSWIATMWSGATL